MPSSAIPVKVSQQADCRAMATRSISSISGRQGGSMPVPLANERVSLVDSFTFSGLSAE
jgi:hypothetical protein